MLAGEGFYQADNDRRDGFTYADVYGFAISIDPKVECLRIKVGIGPLIAPPAELVHQGRQPDWIVVYTEHETIALDYLRRLALAQRR